MRIEFSILIMFFVALLQIALAKFVSIGGVFPNLVLIFALAWCIIRGLDQGIIWALIGGLFLDLFSVFPFGIITLSLVFSIAISGLIIKRFSKESSNLSILVLSFTATVLYGLFFWLLTAFSDLIGFSVVSTPAFPRFIGSTFIQFVYNLILMFLFYYLLSKFSEWIKKREHESSMPYKRLKNGSI